MRPTLALLACACAPHVADTSLPGSIVASYYDGRASTRHEESWALGVLDLQDPDPRRTWEEIVPTDGTFEEAPDALGDEVVFVRTPSEDDWPARDLWKVGLDGSGLVRLTDDGFVDAQGSWSPDGTKILFSSWRDDDDWETYGGADSEVYVMNADGAGVVRLTNSPGEDLDAEFSPDGTKIVFKSTRDTVERKEQIYVMNADGSGAVRLTDNAFSDHDPAWSPDGAYVAIERYLGTGTWEQEGSDRTNPQSLQWVIVVIAADGSGETAITEPNATSLFWLPQWAPDGSRIAFIDNYVPADALDSENRLVTVRPDGSDVRIVEGSDEVGYFDWIP